MKSILKNTLIIALGFVLFGCDDFLDTVPDNRTQLDSPEKITQLLINSYPDANHALICELSGDNMFDNRVPLVEGGSFLTAGAFDRMDTSLFEWNDLQGQSGSDSPYSIWQSFYHAIAMANAALEAVETLKEKGESDENLNAQKGEALAIRAYCHYILVNIFAMPFKDFESSKSDFGITYMIKPETSVEVEYERDNVAYVYEQIINDIEAAIPLINDSSYEQASYHFTVRAAHALAARVYLTTRNYEKVIQHADIVLGSNPSSVLRNWNVTYNGTEAFAYGYFSAKDPANLLLIPTYSVQARRIDTRYGYNREGTSGLLDSGPTWSGRPGHLRGNVYVQDEKYGSFVPILFEFWEYTDKVARVGYAHVMRSEFSTDATLLDRAEAKIFLNRIDEAVEDLDLWNTSHMNRGPLGKDDILGFYTTGKTYFSYEFNTEKISPSFVVSTAQKPYVDCVLHFRRIERIHQGERWFDLKRYGIELKKVVTHNSVEISLPWNDPRRALQIPTDVINAGLEPNPRNTETTPSSFESTLYEPGEDTDNSNNEE